MKTLVLMIMALGTLAGCALTGSRITLTANVPNHVHYLTRFGLYDVEGPFKTQAECDDELTSGEYASLGLRCEARTR
jgi:hypothetical protein